MNSEIFRNCVILKDSVLCKLSGLLHLSYRPELEMPKLTAAENEILDGVRSAYEEWKDANRNFEYAEISEIIDYYTYKIKASEVRYDYYIKLAREKGLKLELFPSREPGTEQ